MPRKPSSISRRLLVATLLSMPLLLGLTGMAIERAHHASLLQGEQDRLQLQFFGLLGAIEWRNGTIDMGDRLKEPRFWQFRSGLYGDIRDARGKYLWRSLSADTVPLPASMPELQAGVEQFSELDIDNAPYFAFRYQAIWEDENGNDIPLNISLYSQQSSFIEGVKRFRHQLFIWLGLVLVFSVALVAGILYWGLLPLRQLAADLLELEQGDRQALERRYPRELTGITRNLNRLLQSEQAQRERYRNTLGDLAHSLKTPLAVLKSEPDNRELREQQLDRMENIISYQLTRAVGGSKNMLQQREELRPLLESLRNTLLKVYHSREIAITLDIAPELRVAADKQDLLELFGNLMDNACKACRTEVRVSSDKDVILIDDDGKGISDDQAALLLDRGRRGDQYGQGQGLGLSIVRDIVDSYDAELHFAKSPLGGCQVRLRFSA